MQRPAEVQDEMVGMTESAQRDSVIGAMSTRRARKVVAYIASNLSGTILVGNLARIACLSCSQFHRAFRRRFGVTPHRYITLKRIEMAQILMLTTGEPLSWISIACGMVDQAHLSRWFRRIVGEAPSQWRTSRRGR